MKYYTLPRFTKEKKKRENWLENQKEENNSRYHWHTKDYKGIVWTAIFKRTGQPRRNGKILRILQPSKTEPWRNKQS